MKPLTVFIGFSILLAGLVLAFPDLMVNPGPLLNGHKALKRDCLSCHTPFRGVKSVQCISCHRQESIGIRSVAGDLLPADSSKVAFHRGVPAGSCVECHTDHKGRNAKKAIKAFRHDALQASLRNSCNACHSGQKPKDALHVNAGGQCAQCHDTSNWRAVLFDHGMLDARLSGSCATCHNADRPSDSIHRQLSSSCGECHGTRHWKPATFDHRSAAASGKQCVSCHNAERPKDTLHRDVQAGCGSCHGTSRWKPATFDHGRYFRLDGDHRASCRTCHTDPSNYKLYTCYNCHEHSPSKVAAEHREEGIYNYQNCIRCHRSGSGDGGGEHGGEHGRRGYEREDDD